MPKRGSVARPPAEGGERAPKRKSALRAAAAADSDDDEDDVEKALVQRDGTCVYFYADVTRSTVCKLYRALREAATAAGGGDVYVYIHSNGGDAYAGMSALDHMRAFRGARITTIVDGFVASAATFLLLGGTRRIAMPNSHVLIHQVSAGFWGKYDELRDEMKNSTSLMRLMKQVYTRYTRMSDAKVEALLRGEVAVNATKCVKLGIAHDIEWQWDDEA